VACVCPDINAPARRCDFVMSRPASTRPPRESARPVGKKHFDKLKARNFIRERNLGINQTCQKRLREMGSSWPNLGQTAEQEMYWSPSVIA
jgi:hypothetical protein